MSDESDEERISWKTIFELLFEETGDSFENIICTLSEEELQVEFDSGYGGTEGKPFTAWSEKYVYFPVCYDGAEWIDYVSRNPDGKPTEHVGG